MSSDDLFEQYKEALRRMKFILVNTKPEDFEKTKIKYAAEFEKLRVIEILMSEEEAK